MAGLECDGEIGSIGKWGVESEERKGRRENERTREEEVRREGKDGRRKKERKRKAA